MSGAYFLFIMGYHYKIIRLLNCGCNNLHIDTYSIPSISILDINTLRGNTRVLDKEEAKIFRVLPWGNTRLKWGDIFSSSIAPGAILEGNTRLKLCAIFCYILSSIASEGQYFRKIKVHFFRVLRRQQIRKNALRGCSFFTLHTRSDGLIQTPRNVPHFRRKWTDADSKSWLTFLLTLTAHLGFLLTRVDKG